MTVPLLGFDNPQFHTGRNTSVRRGARWYGVAEAFIALGNDRQLGPLALQTELRSFDALQDADLGDEHDPECRTRAGLLRTMQRLYPGFRSDELVTLVHFRME
ncbi:hypothetical protein [Stenotrophomonas sp.]|uniref:hypothetical protein n=1 Tax=Stenotrophomonas sp. TaxID=69392 RepID=UPI0028B1BD1D|nr:hypothetical protein [Stenotrophomonas sp.]